MRRIIVAAHDAVAASGPWRSGAGPTVIGIGCARRVRIDDAGVV